MFTPLEESPLHFLSVLAIFVMVLLVGCGGSDTDDNASHTSSSSSDAEPLVIGAIPDQDPQLLQRRYRLLCDHLSEELGVPVTFKPVTDYTAAVLAFAGGDLDLVWFGGLTGVQARLQVDGARAIVQRALDAEFHSVFIVNRDTGLSPIESIDELAHLQGHSFTFGSEASTSGRLMPQYFLQQAGIGLDDFAGEPGFSGSHDRTIDLVSAGSFAAGALNEQVWRSRVAKGEVDTATVQLFYRTPSYHDYHWVAHPSIDERFGEGTVERLTDVLLALNPDDHPEIMDLFHAKDFIATSDEAYHDIEAIGREIGKIR